MVGLLMLSFILSLGLTGYIRRYALVRNIVDIPNQRSSHTIPTPRGGGIAFIIVFIGAIPCLSIIGGVIFPVDIAVVGAGLCVAILGFLDDRRPINVHLRLLVHMIAGVFVLYWLGGMPSIGCFGWVIPAGIFLNGLGLLYLVWMLNLYNFMDGIDGLAAIESLSVCLGAVVLYWVDSKSGLMGLPLVLAAVVAGFLVWNFPRARIFMGDAGSGFLGLMLGIFSIQAAGIQSHYFWTWLILLGVFVVDATVTLLCRLLQGCKVYEAHCSHAYQHAARRFKSHVWVTFFVLMLNIFWLLPIAILVDRLSIDGATGLLVAYLPLLILALVLKAGRP